uniref:Orf3 n=1 Tax=Papaya mosaic potexvirus TaxID=12181 RepID=A0A3G8FWM5_PMV|nr:orf3 [Papaya mosaic virus]
MSSHRVHLTPPTDHSKTFFVLAIGVGIACIFHFALAYRLPTPGDGSHSLPFGGHYRDGTKTISYNSPRGHSTNHGLAPLAAVLCIIFALHVLRPRDRASGLNHHHCPSCSPPPQ